MTILVVDDDPTSRMLTRATLEDHLGAVVEAENGLVGVEALERQPFDLAIVDLDMPVMDGFGVIERARARPETRHLPIIVVTGRDDVVAIERAFALGATSFLCKPINWNVFRHQVSYVLQVARSASGKRAKPRKSGGRRRRVPGAGRCRALGARGRCGASPESRSLSAERAEAVASDSSGIAGEHLKEVLARLRRGSEIVTGDDGLPTARRSVPSTVADAGVGRIGERLGAEAARADRGARHCIGRALLRPGAGRDGARGSSGQCAHLLAGGTKVRLSAVDAAHDRIRFEIEDRGPGIPEHMLAADFEAFARHASGAAGPDSVSAFRWQRRSSPVTAVISASCRSQVAAPRCS